MVMGTGLSPYGFQYVKGEKRWQPIQAELQWVREIFRWFIEEGCKLEDIAGRLNAHQVPTKRSAGRWHRVTVRSIIMNPIYAGQFYWGKTHREHGRKHSRRPEEEWILVPAPIQAVVTEQVMKEAHKRLQLNSELSKRRCHTEYLLRGLVVCADCGKKMRACETKPGHHYYRCISRYNWQRHLPIEERCPGKNMAARNLEELIWDEVVRQVSEPEIIINTLRDQAQDTKQARDQDAAELAILDKEEQTLKRRMTTLLDLVETGDIERALFRERKNQLTVQMEALKQARDEIEQRASNRDTAIANIHALEQFCARIRESLPLLAYADKREFLEALNVRVVTDGQTATITGLLRDTVLRCTGAQPESDDNVLCKHFSQNTT